MGEDGQSAAVDAVDDLDAIREQTDQAIESVEQPDEQMAAIDEVADVIGGIANGTDMLALNANIEAVRAGGGTSGDSDGFAVVADETSAETERVAAAAEEQATRIQQVSSRIGNLSDRAAELDRFETDRTVSGETPTATADGGSVGGDGD